MRMDDINWQTPEQAKKIEESQSEYMRGYRYGTAGKFPKPTDRTDDWNQGYEDGRADWLGLIANRDWSQ